MSALLDSLITDESSQPFSGGSDLFVCGGGGVDFDFCGACTAAGARPA